MSCSKEEIERKRLAALQKRQNKVSVKSNQPGSPGNSSLSPGSPISSNYLRSGPNIVNGHRTFFHPYKRPETSNPENISISKVVSGTLYLISEDRFEVNPSEFCPPLISIFKSITSRNYGKFILFAS